MNELKTAAPRVDAGTRVSRPEFRWRRPTSAQVAAFRAKNQTAGFGYEERGQSNGGYPAGYNVDHNSVRLGWGVPIPEFGAAFEARFGLRLVELYGSTDVGIPIFHPLEEPGDSPTVRGLLIAMPKDAVLAAVQAVEKAGLHVEGVDLASFAVLRAASRLDSPS